MAVVEMFEQTGVKIAVAVLLRVQDVMRGEPVFSLDDATFRRQLSDMEPTSGTWKFRHY